MVKKIPGLSSAFLVLLVIVVILLMQGCAPKATPAASSGQPTDPQKLLIPRWFLRSMTVDGKSYSVPEQGMTLQFEPSGSANGSGGCNDFSGTYQASQDGKLSFGPLMSTMKACAEDEKNQLESAYTQSLSKVSQYRFDGMKLILESADGKVQLGLSMPPK